MWDHRGFKEFKEVGPKDSKGVGFKEFKDSKGLAVAGVVAGVQFMLVWLQLLRILLGFQMELCISLRMIQRN
jgi:hypothetical protein